MSKKSGKSQKKSAALRSRRKRKNKLALFLSVFFLVLTVGGLGLVLLAAGGQKGEVAGGSFEPPGGAEGEEKQLAAQDPSGGEEMPGDEQAQDDVGQEEAVQETAGRYDALLQDAEAMRAQKIYAREADSPDEITMAFAGDILFDSHYAVMARLLQRGGAIGEAFSEDLLEQMRGVDLFMVNNEFPYTDRGAPLEGKTFTFRASPESASYLPEMGVDVVSLANNHSFDYGEQSLLDSLDTLEAMDMPCVGAGRNLEEASQPVSFIVNDTKISILAATQIERNDSPDTRGAGEDTSGVFRCWNVDNLLQAIGEAREDCDFLVVFIHWGTENQAEIDWAQREQAVKIAQAGADLIIGDHSHCLQPVGYVEGVPVIYSLGNFWFNSKSVDTCLVRVTIPVGERNGTAPAVQVLPARQSDCRTTLLHGQEKQRVINYLNSISDSGTLDEEGNLS